MALPKRLIAPRRIRFESVARHQLEVETNPMDLKSKIKEIEDSMELDEALRILTRKYSGSWDGVPTIVCVFNKDGSQIDLPDEVYNSWIVVKGYLRGKRDS